MKTHLYKTAAALVAVLFLAPAFANAEKKVVAKIDGMEITESDIAFAGKEIGAELTRIPEPQRRLVLLEFLIEHQILANAAKKKKVEASPEFEKRKKYYNKRILRNLYLEKFVHSTVSEADAKKLYDEQVAKVKPEKELRASHILVKTEKEAKDIAEQLKKGADFAKLAKEKSTGPSKVRGGDLGFFGKGRMVPTFDKAVFALKKGEVSKPVKTQFGWHVIKLVDERTRPVPAFADLKDRFMQTIIQRKEQSAVRDLRKAAKIEVLDKKLDADLKAFRGSFSGEEPKKK